MKEPIITVGIMSARSIGVELCGLYRLVAVGSDGRRVQRERMTGRQQLEAQDDGTIRCAAVPGGWHHLCFQPMEEAEDVFFELQSVTIGVRFHWQRQENQRFRGSLELIREGDLLTAVNAIAAEEYLTSVISSEMSATAPLELLKAHAVISRSWLLHCLSAKEQPAAAPPPPPAAADEYVRWYERDAHTHFDVCADDHCQRYQGITRASTPQAREAVVATRGQVLTWQGEVCDARFSKCCGGRSERFGTCWADREVPYLQPVDDPFCARADADLLARALNGYDCETAGFYRWQVDYSRRQLSELVRQRSGIDLGDILRLTPLTCGASGRIYRLRIEGSLRSLTVGKELEIRRILSLSHLYSSAFTVARRADGGFRLQGKGWGHGVGLCQIGAAVMADRGYRYDEILHYYYKDIEIEKRYE